MVSPISAIVLNTSTLIQSQVTLRILITILERGLNHKTLSSITSPERSRKSFFFFFFFFLINFYYALCYNVTSTYTNDITVTITTVHNSTPGLLTVTLRRIKHNLLQNTYKLLHVHYFCTL